MAAPKTRTFARVGEKKSMLARMRMMDSGFIKSARLSNKSGKEKIARSKPPVQSWISAAVALWQAVAAIAESFASSDSHALYLAGSLSASFFIP